MDTLSGIAALILAAGKGTRMHSPKPKVMHSLLGSPMLAYSLAALKPLFGDNILIVSGHMAETLETSFPDFRFIRQTEQLGTGHALLAALPALESMAPNRILVINGDAPLITSEIARNFVRSAQGADLAFATILMSDPGAYGRVVRTGGTLSAIVEAKDFDPGIHGDPTGEVNAGMYCVKLDVARQLLPLLRNSNKSGEYYLTDLIALGIQAGLDVRGVPAGHDASLMGVNTPQELATAENLLASRVAASLLAKGVILHSPELLRASPFASIEPGAEISSPCEIYGKSQISAGAEIGPYCVVVDSIIESGAKIRPFSHLEGAVVGPEAIVGPYTRLRPGARLEADAHAGNFVELKKATLGKGSKANHLTYLGDAEIGAGVNIGAGTITCNYDGSNKFKTIIGEHAFIGSNTAMVAPVTIGARSLIGAGSVITKDVPPDEMAIGRSRQKNLPKRKK